MQVGTSSETCRPRGEQTNPIQAPVFAMTVLWLAMAAVLRNSEEAQKVHGT
jgi:hypothetical protein